MARVYICPAKSPKRGIFHATPVQPNSARSAYVFPSINQTCYSYFTALASKTASSLKTLPPLCLEEHVIEKAKFVSKETLAKTRTQSFKYGITQGVIPMITAPRIAEWTHTHHFLLHQYTKWMPAAGRIEADNCHIQVETYSTCVTVATVEFVHEKFNSEDCENTQPTLISARDRVYIILSRLYSVPDYCRFLTEIN
ncbi:ABC transporter B family member 2 [Striga asiatica]|uniref:ABC transporter B family member 2 n=1 Tax=Striga asiatica TaxID=4170 RepID=A0A5A7QPE9_STRAF|nr:ABC transporter B family member 2 [Striga asiatica]